MEVLTSHCGSLLKLNGNLFLTMFIAGLTGGVTHCVSMCSSFAICHNVKKSCCGKIELLKAYGLTYHLGRATTYGVLGFFSALLTKQVTTLPIWPFLSGIMLILAGLMFMISIFPECNHNTAKFAANFTYLRGVILGFMPCGLIYAALMMAATTANPISGMVAMWLFVLGTIPALNLANIGFNLLSNKYQNLMHKITKSVIAMNSIMLFVMAAKVMR